MQFKVFDLGLSDFQESWQFQKEIFTAVKYLRIESALILCSHYPVITLGRQSKKENILVSEYELRKKGIRVYQIERAGEATYHGPGQLTAYPIFNLSYIKKDIHLFLRQLEEVILSLVSDMGSKGIRLPGLTGVWIEKYKIASIGIAIKNWITFHGISINVKKDDLDNFWSIRPCGMDIEMTSLETVLGKYINIDSIKKRLIEKFEYTFNITALPMASFKNTDYIDKKQEARVWLK